MAASTVNTFRELGGLFGVAGLGAILNAQLTQPSHQPPAQAGHPCELPVFRDPSGHPWRRGEAAWRGPEGIAAMLGYSAFADVVLARDVRSGAASAMVAW
jgi:hypothetical protein